MSMCAHGPSPANSSRNFAARTGEPWRSVELFFMSAKVGVDVAAVALVQRERPDEVAAALARCGDPVAPFVVVREEAGVEVAERELHRAGQRREVDDVRRSLAPRVPERVGEHEPAFRVGVRDLDRLAVRRAEDVAGAERVAAGKILRRGEDGDCAHRQAEGCDRADAVQRAGAARHVALHVLHLRGGLERDPARVERDRLADEAEVHVLARRRRGLVAQDDQARLVAAAAADGGERAHPELVEVAQSEHVRLQVVELARERLRVLAERVRD